MKTWDPYKAKRWLLNQGMDHIRDGLAEEGGLLIFESKWGKGGDSFDEFKESLQEICWWDDDMIADAVKEIESL